MEINPEVSIVKCPDYNKNNVKKSIVKSVSLIGGFEKYIRQGKRILIKPNLLLPVSPEKAVTTHPVFLEAVIEIISEVTGNIKNIIIADSFGPVVPYTVTGMESVYRQTGVAGVARRTGCKLNFSTEYSCVSNPEGKVLKKIEIIRPALEADVIINLPKFKTHNLTAITGAVKNMFGIVPGFNKTGYHLRFDDLEKFVTMLLDIVTLFRPALNVMDGILGMEGDGPGRSGTPRKVGLVMAGNDALAIDVVMGRLMNIDEKYNNFVKVARDMKMPSAEYDNIRIRGEEMDSVKMEDFIAPKTLGQKKLVENRFISTYIMPLIRNAINQRPCIITQKCSHCGTCIEVCPQKCIIMTHKEKIVFDYSRCIRCFCCSEMCPEGAVDVRYPLPGNLLLNMLGWGGKKGK